MGLLEMAGGGEEKNDRKVKHRKLGAEFSQVSAGRRVYSEEVPTVTKHSTTEFGRYLKIICLKCVDRTMGDVIKGEYVGENEENQGRGPG